MAIFLLHLGDSMERIEEPVRALQPDRVICDPPYGLSFMGRSWDRIDGSALQDSPMLFPSGREASGMEMWHIQWLRACYEALPPGGEVWAFSGTRTMHSLAAAFEMAGFEVSGLEAWVYGSGFPKSLNVSKALDKMAGAARQKIRVSADKARNPKSIQGGHGVEGGDRPWMQKAQELGYHEMDGTDPVTEAAKKWDGWGTAIKPAWEPVIVGRKPK